MAPRSDSIPPASRNGDLVGEWIAFFVRISREAGICYPTLALATDYDLLA